ncbi:pilin [bacterium]|nr:pilin [bacterium]
MKYFKYTLALILVSLPILASASLVDDSGLVDAGEGTTLIKRDIPTVVGIVINSLLSLMGVLFTVLIIWGGFKWMTSAGNSQQVDDAKNIIKNSVIGLVIVLASYAIVKFVLDSLDNSVGTGGETNPSTP